MLYVKSYCPHSECCPTVELFPHDGPGLASAIEYCVLAIYARTRALAFNVFSNEIWIDIPEHVSDSSPQEIAAFMLMELHVGLGDILAAHLHSPCYDSCENESSECDETSQIGDDNPTGRKH